MATPPSRRETLSALGFLAPNLLGFLVFTFLPVLAAFGLSLADWDLSSAPRFVGLANFARILGFERHGGQLAASDPQFWRYLGNTLFLMLGIPLSIAGSLALALLLNQKLRGIVAFRTICFLPTVCSIVAVCILWKWILHSQPPEYGLLNSALVSLGVRHPPDWLGDMRWAKPAFILMGLWIAVGGYNCVLFLAGLQNIPSEFYEAADLDGASWWHKLRHITWPLLSPTTFFVLIMSIIAGFQGGFAAAFLMTDGGPAGATTTLMYYIYNNAFQWHRMGYAAALACILFAMVFGFTLLNFKVGQKVVHYE